MPTKHRPLPEGPFAYIVGKYGSTIRAKNGRTGITEAAGSDFSTVMNSILSDGGLIHVKKGKYTVENPLIVSKPTYIKGEGMALDSGVDGTILLAASGMSGENGVIEYDEASIINFGGVTDLTIRNDYADNGIYVKSLVDAYFERIFINHGVYNGIYILGTAMNMWNIWIKDSLFENIGIGGITIDPADYAILKVHIMDNYFFADDMGMKIQRYEGSGGSLKYAHIKGNQFFDIGKVAIMLWKVSSWVDIAENIIYRSGKDAANVSNAIRVGDGDVSADKCSWISIVNNLIDGLTYPKWGVSLEGYSDRVSVQGNMITGCATAPYNAGVNCTNITHVDNVEV